MALVRPRPRHGSLALPDETNLLCASLGDISPAELQIAMNSLGLKPTLAEVKEMIQEIDADGDGQIDFHGTLPC